MLEMEKWSGLKVSLLTLCSLCLQVDHLCFSRLSCGSLPKCPNLDPNDVIFFSQTSSMVRYILINIGVSKKQITSYTGVNYTVHL